MKCASSAYQVSCARCARHDLLITVAGLTTFLSSIFFLATISSATIWNANLSQLYNRRRSRKAHYSEFLNRLLGLLNFSGNLLRAAVQENTELEGLLTDVERFWSHQSFIWGEGTALSIKWCNARVDAFFFKGRMCQHDIRIHTSHKRSWGFVHRCRLPKHTYLQRFSEPKGILLKFGLNCFSLKRCTVEFLRCPSRGSGESAA